MSLMYLEDYLELVSFLPQEFRDRLTKVRELDLEASNRRDNIEKRKQQLAKTGPARFKTEPDSAAVVLEPLSETDRLVMSAEIEKEYDKIVEIGVEKVQIISGLEELMLRYNKRLTADTEKFKLELEADNPGITESLEERAEQEMKNFVDSVGAKTSSAEAQRVPTSRRVVDMGTSAPSHRKQTMEVGRSIVTPKQSAALMDGGQHSRRVVNLLNGGGGGMLQRAATQAIAATQQMQHGRRTASWKASYEAVRNTPTTSSRGDSADRGEGSSGSANVVPKSEARRRGHRRKNDLDKESDQVGGEAGDDDKQLYCFCKTPSAGFMVACDNEKCAIEWFHGTCVGITDQSEVEGKKWYCPTCREDMKKDRKHKPGKLEIGKMDSGSHVKQDNSVKTSKKYRKP